MKIAQVAPLFESVPPVYYGGTERIVSYLTEELVNQGHEVTLFASGDSTTKARLISPCPRSLRLDPDCIDYLPYFYVMLEQVFKEAAGLDLIHFHIDYLHFPLSRRQLTPHVTTLHGRLNIPDLTGLYREFSDIPLISISAAQREPLPWAGWQATVHHGIPLDLYELKTGEGNYLAFLGRVSREKRVDRAVEIATLAKMKLKIAAKVDAADRDYFRTEIEPLLDNPLVEFMGEIDEKEKGEFLGDAYALLFPIDWCEPFGMVMIEAMACGTPVIAYPHGSVPEVLEDGITGFIVQSTREAAAALEKTTTFDRARCRRIFEKRFSVTRMAEDYVKIYQRLCARDNRGRGRRVQKEAIKLPPMAGRPGAGLSTPAESRVAKSTKED